jgi:hypothetical protein
MSSTMEEMRTLQVHDQGVRTIEQMRDQLAIGRDRWENHRPEQVTKMAASLATNLANLFAHGFGGEARVYRDGDLSLIVHTSSITFGMIFFPFDRPDFPIADDPRFSQPAPREGRYCTAVVEGERPAYCLLPFNNGERTCFGHDTESVTLPVLGEWSFHS